MDRRNKKNSITWNGDASEWFVEAITHIEIKKVVKWHNREKSFGHFGDADVRMPLRYNNDKRKKPLFSRGLSVCRHLFNSFSKLKCDEKIIEKRRLFH